MIWRGEDVDLRSARLHVRVYGDSGPPLLLIHGVTRAGIDWLPIAPFLSQFGQLHAIDQRGHGRSQHALSSYRVRDYLSDACDYLDRIGQPTLVVGHSLGGMVAAGLAAERPDLVRAVVMEDPTFEMTGTRIHETFFPDLFNAYLPHAGSNRPVGEVAKALAGALVGAPGGPRVPLGVTRDAATLRFTAASLKQLDPNVLRMILDGHWLNGFDIAAVLAAVQCPALLLQADFAAGGALPDDYARTLADQIRDVTHVRLARVGHNIHTMATESMRRIVAAFIAALEL